MASTVIYPPSLNSTIPAFVATPKVNHYEGEMVISFDTSDISMVSLDNVYAHATIKFATTGKSIVLNYLRVKNESEEVETVETIGIGILVDLSLEKDGENKRIIRIPYDQVTTRVTNGDVFVKGWVPEQILNVQIRLSYIKWDEDETHTAATPDLNSWLNDPANTGSFSEWSTVAATQPIRQPEVNLDCFSNNIFTSKRLTGSFVSMNGNIKNPVTVSQHEIILYKKVGTEYIEIEKSELFSTDTTKIDYTIQTADLSNSGGYKVTVNYITKSAYRGLREFKGQFNFDEDCLGDVTFTYEDEDDSETARNKIKIDYEMKKELSDVTINVLRLNSLDGFMKAEKIYSYHMDILREDSKYSFYIIDALIQSGIFYQYGLQLEYSDTDGVLYQSVIKYDKVSDKDNYKIIDFEYSFLLGANNQQLTLQFDNTMNSIKPTIPESKVDTVDGKPFIFRNGSYTYKTFPINGLIASQMDEKFLFLKENEIYYNDKIANLYKQRGISQYRDFNIERFFRDKVYEFLIDGKPKLFKSPTEGNVLIQLMNINFSPNQTLDRMIYSFSAEGIEIGEATLSNLSKYNIEVCPYTPKEEVNLSV